MAADASVVKARVTEALNVCSAGGFSTTIASTNLDRNASAISECVTEAALDIARYIIADPTNYHRNLFISNTPVSLTHQAEMPDYMTDYDIVEIERYSSAGYRNGIRANVFTIDEYRANPSNRYDSIAHNSSGSTLGGYYALEGGRAYFTGNAARTYCPVVSRSTVTTLIPDEYEGIWTALAISYTTKEGDNMAPVAAYYRDWAMNRLATPDTSMPAVQAAIAAINGG